MKEFNKKEFAFRLSQKRNEKQRKQEETDVNAKKQSFNVIALSIGVSAGVVRNAFSGVGIGIDVALSLCDWANLNINDFYK